MAPKKKTKEEIEAELKAEEDRKAGEKRRLPPHPPRPRRRVRRQADSPVAALIPLAPTLPPTAAEAKAEEERCAAAAAEAARLEAERIRLRGEGEGTLSTGSAEGP
jgi:hypothetical protein